MTIVNDMLKQMAAVRQPQRQFLAPLFAPIRARRGRLNSRNLSRYCDYSERTMARQFRTAFAWPDFQQRLMTAARDPRAALLSAQEASFIPQSGTQTLGLGHFFNGCTNRAARGLAIATLAVGAVPRRCACTLAVAPTPPGADKARSEPAEEAPRLDCYPPQLRHQRQRLPQRGTYHWVAGSFAKKQYRAAVVALKLPPITKLRSDATWRFLDTGPPPQPRGPWRKYDGKVHFHDLRRVEALGPLEESAPVQLSPALLWHGSLKRQRRVVGLVNRTDPATPRSIVLAAPEVAVDGRTLVEYSVARVQIECLLRDSQPFTARADCQARAAAALDFPFTAALATLNLARAAAVRASPPQAPQVLSLASWKQCHFKERLLAVFIESLALDPPGGKNQPCYDELRTYGAIAA